MYFGFVNSRPPVPVNGLVVFFYTDEKGKIMDETKGEISKLLCRVLEGGKLVTRECPETKVSDANFRQGRTYTLQAMCAFCSRKNRDVK